LSAYRHIFSAFGQIESVPLTSTIVLLFVVGTGCGSTLSPLYADFRIDTPPAPATQVDSSMAEVAVPPDSATTRPPDSTAHRSIQDRIASALVQAGWELDEAPSANALSTREVEIIDWGLYDVRVSLDVVPVNDKFVRVYVHPYRQYFWGSRSKMSYMNHRVRSYVFPDLADAFKVQGIVPLGAPPEEDAKDNAQAADSDQKATARNL